MNTHRLLVRGTRIPYEEAEIIVEESVPTENNEITSTWEQEYMTGIYVGIGIVVIAAVIALGVWLYRRYRHEGV